MIINKKVSIPKNLQKKTGMKLLIHEYREKFRVMENMDFYSKDDFREAERKFVKFALLGQIHLM